MKKGNFILGFVCGAVLFGGATAFAAGIIAAPCSASVTVDGKPIEVTAYEINDNNYFKLRDIAEAVDFGVTWDEATQTIAIDTTKHYESEMTQAGADTTKTTGAITVPQSESSFRPAVGTVIQTDNGTTFTVMKQKPEESALPTPTCDWSQFPERELPKVTCYAWDTGVVAILNLHETRRMQYTLYNLIGGNSLTWVNGEVANYQGQPTVRVIPGIEYTIGLNAPMWPWQEQQLKEVFESDPLRTFRVVAYDKYRNGKFDHTEYLLQS